MLAAAQDDADRVRALLAELAVLLQQLGIAQDAVERCAQLVADVADVARLGLVRLVGLGPRGLGDLARLLQLQVGVVVRLDLAQQQAGLAVRFLLGDGAALVRQHQPPGHDRERQQQRGIDLGIAGAQRLLQRVQRVGRGRQLGQTAPFLAVEQAQQTGQQQRDHQHQQQVMRQSAVQMRPAAARRQPAQRPGPLHRQAGVRLAAVAAACVERAAQRADPALVGRTVGAVGRLVLALADHAAHQPGHRLTRLSAASPSAG